MTLPMHSPESRVKVRDVKVTRLERSLNTKQRAAYERWEAACMKQGVRVSGESRY